MNLSDAKDVIRSTPSGKEALTALLDEVVKRAEAELCATDCNNPEQIQLARFKLEGAREAKSRLFLLLYSSPKKPVLK